MEANKSCKSSKSSEINFNIQKKLVKFDDKDKITIKDFYLNSLEKLPNLIKNEISHKIIIDDFSQISELIFDKKNFHKEKGYNLDFFIEFVVQTFKTEVDKVFTEKQDNSNNSDDILSSILNNFDIIKFVKIIIKKCIPKYSTFLLTFMIMQDFLVLIKGHLNPYNNMNQIFFTCFLFVSNYFKDSSVFLEFLII